MVNPTSLLYTETNCSLECNTEDTRMHLKKQKRARNMCLTAASHVPSASPSCSQTSVLHTQTDTSVSTCTQRESVVPVRKQINKYSVIISREDSQFESQTFCFNCLARSRVRKTSEIKRNNAKTLVLQLLQISCLLNLQQIYVLNKKNCI